MKALTSFVFASAVLAGASAAHAQSAFVDHKSITTAAAEKIGKTCVAFAQAHGYKMGITVLDANGDMIYLYRMDGASNVGLDTGSRKAKAAYYFRTPTSVLAKRIAEGQPNNAAILGFLPVLGGIPIMVDGEIAGAIGVGGGPSPNDELCAQAGLDSVMPRAAAH